MQTLNDSELTLESSKFALYYLKQKWDGISDLVLKHAIQNAAAHSFFAGVRFAEKEMEKKEAEKCT